MKTPIAVFACQRPGHLWRCLTALARCARLEECAVTIFCDSPRSDSMRDAAEATRKTARDWAGKHGAEVREASENRGLARSIVGGVTELSAAHGRVIVLEDDLEPAPDFLHYMLTALDRWSAEPQVMQVAGFRLPFQWTGDADAFFLPCTTTWGWATWQRAWQHFRWEPADAAALDDPAVAEAFDLGSAYPYSQMLRGRIAGRNDSWGILWWWSVFRAGGQVLYPRESLLAVGGFDGTGTHCDTDDVLLTNQTPGKFPQAGARMPSAPIADPEALRALSKYLRGTQPWWRRILALLSAR
jgi:hypothetical protein